MSNFVHFCKISIYIENGEIAATYEYNAWGEILSMGYAQGYEHIAEANPFRYRGYYYDTETGFYYLNSRYYDPQVKRFISPDDIGYLGANGDLQAYNLYAYCSNNPVMNIDPMGTWNWKSIVKASLIVIAVAAVAAATVLTCGTALAACGVIAASTTTITTAAIATAGAAVAAGTFNIVQQTKEKPKEEELDFADVGISTTAGAGRGLASSVCPGFGGTLISSAISGGESAIKAARRGATTREQLFSAASRGFGESFICYGIGWGLDQYFGISIISQVTSGELFGGIMGLGN